MSARTPGALVNGAEANVPDRRRPMRREAKLGAKAQRKLKAR